MDREKVIKSLKWFRDRDSWREGIMIHDDHADVRKQICDNALALLKEQEAVEPTIDEYGNKRCGSCGHKLQSIADPDLFCCKCGKPVLQEGR